MVARDKEQLIRKLLKEGRDWDYIGKVAHCSPNTIQKVKEKGEQGRTQKIKSKRSQALLMYDKDYSPFKVAVRLDIPPQEAENYKIEYWRLRYMYELEQIYKDRKDSLPFIINKFQELHARNISLDQLTQAINLVNSLPKLHNEYCRLNGEIQAITADYKQRQEGLWNIEDELRLKKTELHNLDIEYHRIEKIINTDYDKLFETVSKIIADRNILLNAALLSIIRAIRKYPDQKTFATNLSALEQSICSQTLNDSNELIGSGLIAEADSIYDDICTELVEKVIGRPLRVYTGLYKV